MAATDPLATVRGYVDAFNSGDGAAMAAAFSGPGSILDGLAPHLWLGSTVTQDWYRDVLREAEQHGASDYFVELGEPLHNDVTGEAGYVVVPATLNFRMGAEEIHQTGAVFTVALRRAGGGWRIAGWAWAKGTRAKGTRD
jgi:hypothetical protein